MSEDELKEICNHMGLAMSLEDLAFCQTYFRDEEKRDPTITEIRVIDTYWSDHCRHTTFMMITYLLRQIGYLFPCVAACPVL